jgi:hypothetical protein
MIMIHSLRIRLQSRNTATAVITGYPVVVFDGQVLWRKVKHLVKICVVLSKAVAHNKNECTAAHKNFFVWQKYCNKNHCQNGH